MCMLYHVLYHVSCISVKCHVLCVMYHMCYALCVIWCSSCIMYHVCSEFLRLKRVPIEPLPEEKDTTTPPITSATASTRLTSIRNLALSDRDIMEKGQRAYVSWIRAYKEHQCHYIFVFNHLPFASVARGMGLLFVSGVLCVCCDVVYVYVM